MVKNLKINDGTATALISLSHNGMQPYDISIFIDDESGDIQRESQIYPILDIWSSGGANISKETIIKGLGKSGVTIPKGFFKKNYKGKKDELSTNK